MSDNLNLDKQQHLDGEARSGVPAANFDYLFNADPPLADRERILAETFLQYEQHLNPGFLKFKRSVKHDAHGVEWRGEGVYMYDIHGHRFTDCLGGYGVFTLGHRHPHVMRRVKQTMERIGLYSQELLNPLQAILAREIALRSPGDLQYVYYHCGGGESNDAAIKLARLATGRQLHVSFSNSFHGKTIGALSATNRPAIKKPFQPLAYGFQFAPWNETAHLELFITDQVASVIIEPVQGEGGVNVPSREFLQAVRARCTEVGALLHVDEVQAGWGRSGRFFCIEHFGVEPDIMTMGKAMGGGIFPQSALIATPAAFSRMPENPWWLTNTFSGSQLACAASLATIEVYEQENVLKQSREKGAYLKGELERIAESRPELIAEVRGLGLWVGLETRTAAQGSALADELFKRDVLVAQTINNPRTLRFQPPLIITREQLDSVLSAVEDSVKELTASPVAG